MARELLQIDKLQKEFTSLACAYDQRWASYLSASIQMTLAALANLRAKRVLDVGCGTGQLLEALAAQRQDTELFGIDSVPAMLDVAKERIGERATLLQGEAAKLPFDDAKFRLVVSTSALHYFADADAALHEIRRVISPSGNLIITDWCRDYFWMRLLNRILPWTQRAHGHTFSSNELEQNLAETGFKIVAVNKKKIDWFWGLMTVHATTI